THRILHAVCRLDNHGVAHSLMAWCPCWNSLLVDPATDCLADALCLWHFARLKWSSGEHLVHADVPLCNLCGESVRHLWWCAVATIAAFSEPLAQILLAVVFWRSLFV